MSSLTTDAAVCPWRHLRRLRSPERGVELWLVRLSDLTNTELGFLGRAIDAAEHARAARFHFPRDRARQIATRAFLRHLLSEKLERPALSLSFREGPHGKPWLEETASDGRQLHFNLSHTAGWALFALAWEREIGVDLEAEESIGREGRDLYGLAARILSPNELDKWSALPDRPAKVTAFLRAWTMKEALGKASGEGLAYESPASAPWIVHELYVPPGLCAMLAVAEPRF